MTIKESNWDHILWKDVQSAKEGSYWEASLVLYLAGSLIYLSFLQNLK